MDAKKLTPRQRDALICARDKGSPFCNRSIKSRAGGAYRRMVYRLADAGYLADWPYQITDKGRAAIAAHPTPSGEADGAGKKEGGDDE